MKNEPRKRTGIGSLLRGGLLVGVGFLLGRCNNDEIKPVAKYDITGDGLPDYVVELSVRTETAEAKLGYVDGREVSQVITRPAEESYAPETREFVRTGPINQLGVVNIPIDSNNSRVYSINPSKEYGMLEIEVNDGSLYSILSYKPVFDKSKYSGNSILLPGKSITTLPNPRHKNKK